jgi:1,4-dihydroxy-2-naphthoyl-CoA hydrolase
MPFDYFRTVRFADTDAAGVVFFANYLVFCHEAYEESLAANGIELQTFFKTTGLVFPFQKAKPRICVRSIQVTNYAFS